MVCPRCGEALSANGGRCRCGSSLNEPTVLTGVVPFDTTGLPHGATFGALTSLNGVTTLEPEAFPGSPLRDSLTTLPTQVGKTAPTTGDAGTLAGATIGGDAATVAGQVRSPGEAGPLKVGQSFGARYHIIKLLGAGGMGAVYQAWDTELGVAVALKVIRGRTVPLEMQKRFKNELLLARSVTHKNVVRIHDLGEIDGKKFITMSYVQGDDLATLLRTEGKFPIQRTLGLARQIAAGLQAAHDAGVVHRDLKPANIMIGADDLALIMDFGISASAEEAADGGIIGTLEYMAPEQGAGQTTDGRADIYAFGLILYEMLVGPRTPAPTTAQERIDAMRKRSTQGVPPLRQIDESVPEPVNDLVMRCLEIDPAARFPAAAALNAALARLDEHGAVIPEVRRLTRRIVSVSGAIVLALLAGTYYVAQWLAPKASVQHPIVRALITDFDNRTGNANLDGPLGEALSIALEGAPFVELYKARDARALAKQLSAGGDRITRETGVLIARREGLKVVVQSAIDKTASGYRLSLQAIDPSKIPETVLTAATEDARDDAAVLGAVERLARKVRLALGESKSEMDKAAAAETFTAGSLGAMQAYIRAQDLVNGGRVQEASAAYRDAIAQDPRFGRAYSGLATIYRNLGRLDLAEATFNEALKYVDRMSEREKFRTLGLYYNGVSHNYRKAVETYEALLAKYPFDQAALSNLAFSYSALRDFAKAREISERLVSTYPNYLLGRNNFASYALYAGDFDKALEQVALVLKQNDKYQFAFLPLALAQGSKGDLDAARDTYEKLGQLNAFGASVSRLGLADLAMYRGQFKGIATLLAPSAIADEKGGDKTAAAQKYNALADAQLAIGLNNDAAASARKAAALDTSEAVLFPAALTLVRTGHIDEAQELAATLANRLENEPRSYARLIDAEAFRARRRLPDAIDAVRDAQQRHDSWWARFLLGRLYEEIVPPHHAEALAELELAVKRRGEAADAFIADMPTLRYVPQAYYWLGRAQEGVQAAAAARTSYQQFLALREHADVVDPLATDARARTAQLTK
jgi:eukaryotic-like serine/threonine-protein kinase